MPKCEICGAPCTGRLCPECEREVEAKARDMARLPVWLVARRQIRGKAV